MFPTALPMCPEVAFVTRNAVRTTVLQADTARELVWIPFRGR